MDSGESLRNRSAATSARRIATRHRQPLFRVSDVKRAVKAAQSLGIRVGRIEIGPDGSIVLISATDSPAANDNVLDSWMAKHARSA